MLAVLQKAARFAGLEISRTRAGSPVPWPTGNGRGGWFPVIREPYMGAWQENQEISAQTVLTSSAVFACVTLIASDIGKLGLRLVSEDKDGVWSPVSVPAFSPVLRKPNRYQTRIEFIEQWMTSKLTHGNTYVLKQRDERGVVAALYVLNPTKVKPLVAPDGGVFYELSQDDLVGIQVESQVVVPAREIIHDKMVTLYHPLCGVSPIYACGISALQSLAIQANSQRFFTNGSQPGGVLTAPGTIDDATVKRMKDYWETNFSGANVGKVAVLGDGLKYEQMAVNATDSQLIEQLQWTATNICSAFHVPPYMIAAGPPPPFANVEPLMIQYYSQCLQTLIEKCELCLDEGLELPKPYGTEFDLDDLMRMDSVSKTQAASSSISSGGMAINEARKKFFGLGPVPGGETPYLQQQYWPVSQLSTRTAPDGPAAPPDPTPEPAAPPDDTAKTIVALRQKALALYGELYAA